MAVLCWNICTKSVGATLIFAHTRRYIIPTVTLSAGALNARMVGKICVFKQNLLCFLDAVWDWPIVTNKKSQVPIDLMTLSDRERLPGFPGWSLHMCYGNEIPFVSTCFYDVIHAPSQCNLTVKFWELPYVSRYRLTDKIQHGTRTFLGSQARPYPNGRGPSAPSLSPLSRKLFDIGWWLLWIINRKLQL